ncbi:tumor necrosis factor ligand superfamily member 12 [Amia ocellicauda]|uniref:tumor necrosis factor ligand superfamily member 12 n=1 Tax=Amia ocellicauda TaxID=2972642 RepID=UPI0034645074
MQAVLQRRRRQYRSAFWGVVAVAALTLAGLSVVLSAWSWAHSRDLSRSFQTLQGQFAQVNAQREAVVQLLLEKSELLGSHRVKRKARAKNGHNRVASHFEIKSKQEADDKGVIKGWVEQDLNVTSAVHYDATTGTFTLEKSGLYFVYCQVHFNESKAPFVKLEVRRGQEILLRCLEGYSTAPPSGSHPFHFLKPCQVSGLLRLAKGVELRTNTGDRFSLHNNGNHYFGLFKVQ